MNRILIVGISGTGKTRIAAELAQKMHLPVVHLDAIFWKSSWQAEDPAVVEAKIRDAIRQPQWIIEGYIEPLSQARIEAADTVLYLDYSGATAMSGGLKRWLKYRGKPRPEMPAGNTESFSHKFLLTMLRRDERGEIEAAIRGQEGKVVRLRTRRATRAYTARL